MTPKLTFPLLMLLSALAVGWSFAPSRVPRLRFDPKAEVNIGAKDDLYLSFLDNVDRGQKIVGGTEIAPYSAPYLVLVGKYRGSGFYASCGGSVLDSTHILSAAHCFKDLNPSKYVIIAGEHDYSRYLGNEQVRMVSSITRHPRYKDGRHPNDVAVLTLSKPLTLGGNVKAAELNTDGTCPLTGATCTVIGWGTTTENGKSSRVPLKVDVPVQWDDTCSAVYGSSYGCDQMCAGAEGIDSCQGDSGGPLVCQCGGSLKLVGVVSYGRGCARKNYPGVYAKVFYFSAWIKKTAGLQ